MESYQGGQVHLCLTVLPYKLCLASFPRAHIDSYMPSLLQMLTFPDQWRFFSLTELNQEISMILSRKALNMFDPKYLTVGPEKWRAIIVSQGDILQGSVISVVSEILAKSGFSIFYLSASTTDFVLVMEHQLEGALECLSNTLSIVKEEIRDDSIELEELEADREAHTRQETASMSAPTRLSEHANPSPSFAGLPSLASLPSSLPSPLSLPPASSSRPISISASRSSSSTTASTSSPYSSSLYPASVPYDLPFSMSPNSKLPISSLHSHHWTLDEEHETHNNVTGNGRGPSDQFDGLSYRSDQSEASGLRLESLPHRLVMLSWSKAEMEVNFKKLIQIVFFPNESPHHHFFSLTCTEEEVSLVLDLASYELVHDSRPENSEDTSSLETYRVVRVCGEWGFYEVGIVYALAKPLSCANIDVIYLSTFKTDLVMVPEIRYEETRRELRKHYELID